MKNWILIYCLVLGSDKISAQSYMNEHTPAELKVGDQMPDIPLGTVVNNYTGKSRFSDFKGKLVILDFWSTYCSSCLELMPHMEELQKEFGDQIQIFLVNPRETQVQIEQRFKKNNFKLPGNLPSIVAANKLDTLFPTPQGHPHHVWIDASGQILVRGSKFSTYKEKVRDLLSGKNVFSMKDNNTTPLFDETKPYSQLLNQSNTPIRHGSFFTAHNNEYSAYVGGSVTDVVDSVTGTIRSTFVNKEILDLYRNVFKDSLQKNRDNIIYSTHGDWIDNCLLLVNDTTRYTFRFILSNIDSRDWNDKTYVKSKFCYEQVTPMSLSNQQRCESMLKDLNLYFGNLFGTEGSLEKRKLSVYILVRTSTKDNLTTKTKTQEYKIEDFIEKGVKMIRYVNRPLRETLVGSFARLHRSKSHRSIVYFLDETGFEKNVDIVLPADESITSIETLRIALKPYSLNIIEAEREMKMLVIRDKKTLIGQ